MDCLREKEVKYLFVFLACCLLWHGAGNEAIRRWEWRAAGEMLTQQTRILASAMLEMGMSQVEAGSILSSHRISPAGNELVERLGLEQAGDCPGLRKGISLGWELLFAGMLLGGVWVYLDQKERLYKEAVRVTERYLKGDYSGALPCLKEGTLYRFFSLTDSLARALKAGGETQQQSREFLKRTISDISHQLKTPLAALSLYNEIILEEAGQEETVREFSHKTTAALDRIRQLTGMLLKIARLDAGGICFEKKYHPVAEVAERAVEELRTRAALEEKELLISREEGMLFCDLPWSVEALQNLVKNALDHTERGGKIRISWERTPLMFRISVTDNGEGIAPEDFHHIFKRFYTGNRSQNREEGLGLGLPLVRAIMEGQGGSVGVRSIPCEETVFTLSFLTQP